MKILRQLPKEICISIQNYCLNKFPPYINKEKEMTKQQEPFFHWYVDWISFISRNEKDTWKKVKKYKNNLPFINLVMKEFETEIDHFFRLEEKPFISTHLQNYFQYANELTVEAYGEELQKKTYLKSELLNIIKECERVIKNNLLNHKRPSHNIVTIR